MKCGHCDGDTDDPGHDQRCDGHQGALDWDVEDGPPPVRTLPRHRETSIQAFYNAVESGTILTRREQSYAGLKELNAATADKSTTGEVFEYLKEQRHLGLRYDSNTSARFTELRDMGVIREAGQRPCRVTGQTCITWEVVPRAEYVGPATIRRCPCCKQVVARDVPAPEADDAQA